MSYDKRLSKSERKQISKTRRSIKDTGFRESEKHLNALKHRHISVTKTVKHDVLQSV